jgi:ABC-type lipoprotein export system ATPase subunit
MDIHFKNVMPTPLASINHGENSIWGADVKLLEGERVILNASSGKGKSTFTFTSTGLRADYTGSIFYDKTNVLTYSPEDWSEIRTNKIATVYQDLQLFNSLSVAENLFIKNSLTNFFTEKELLQLLQELEIEDKWNQKCGLLSMGQQQRLAIIRAVAQPFKWLIMDEPFSHLDEANTQRCLGIIDRFANKQNAGFVLTTLGDFHSFNYTRELNL